MRRSSKRILTGCAAAGGLLAGIATVIGASPGTAPSAAASELTPFDGCEQLRSWYVRAALPHVTAWGWDTSGPIVYDDVLMMPRAAGAPTESAAPDAAATKTEAVGNGATGTNLQEADVDEPDLAKTDGEIVALIRNGDLVVYDASGAQGVEIGRLDLPHRQQIRELLLVDDRAVLLGSATASMPYIEPPIAMPRDLPYDRRPAPSYPTEPRTTITTVDLTDPAAPVVQRTESLQGELVPAREHDGTVRVVSTWLPTFAFVRPLSGLTPGQALAKNRSLVRNTAATDWLPASRVNGGSADSPLSCEDVRHPADPAGVGTISVVTMDPDEPEARTGAGVAADGDLTYASADRLYVATADDGWSSWTGTERAGGATTDIHAFDVTGDQTSYVGSGQV